MSGGKATGTVLFVLLWALLPFLSFLSAPASAAHSVVVEAPVGGEVWTGGTKQTIRATVSGSGEFDYTVAYYVGGAFQGMIQWGTIYEPHPNPYTRDWSWTVPRENLAGVTVRVCMRGTGGAGGNVCASSAPFAIDATGPRVVRNGPIGSNVPVGASISLEFSEPMNLATLGSAISFIPAMGPATFVPIAPNAVEVRPVNPLPQGATYTVLVDCNAKDASTPGNPLTGCTYAWAFRTSTAPTVRVTSPAGGERLTSGATITVRWAASDMEDPVPQLRVSLESTVNRTTYWELTPLASGLPGDATYAWTVPPANNSGYLTISVVDTAGLTAGASTPFLTIDGTPPSVLAVTPGDGAAGVGWTAPVLVTFSEAMNATLRPQDFGVWDGTSWVRGTLAWDDPSRMRFTPTSPYRAGTVHTAFVNATLRDDSNPGHALAAPASWNFTTAANTDPAILLTATIPPIASGGAQETISWTVTDDQDPSGSLQVFLEFWNGATYTPIQSMVLGNGSRLWDVPAIDLATAAVRARVVDTQGGQSAQVLPFQVDATRPDVRFTSPAAGAQEVSPWFGLQIAFTEPVWNITDAVALRRVATSSWVPLLGTQVVRVGMKPDTFHISVGSPAVGGDPPPKWIYEGQEYEAILNGTARDYSAPGNYVLPRTWRFRVAVIPPTIAVDEPRAGTRWTGGSPQTVLVRSSDIHSPPVIVTIELSVDGVTFTPLSPPTVLTEPTAAFSVLPPAVDAPRATLRVCSTDTSGITACALLAVDIDATRPRVQQTVPTAGSVQVHPDAPFVLHFAESMNRTSVEAAFTLNPSVPLTFRWETSVVANDTLYVDHPRLLELRTYVASLSCAARDASLPGLTLGGACPVYFSFTTGASPSVYVAFPAGGERLTGGVAHDFRWYASDEDATVVTQVDLFVDGAWTAVHGPVVQATGEGRVSFGLPTADGNASLRVRVRDAMGLEATHVSPPFTIDSTPPSVVSTAPIHGARGIGRVDDFVIVFSEPVVPTSLATSEVTFAPGVTITPTLYDVRIAWSQTNVPYDTVTISHAPLRFGANVSIALDGVRDRSTPGNILRETIAFSILHDTVSPVPEILIQGDVEAGGVVVLDASGSTDNDGIANYTWTVTDANGTVVARLYGPVAEFRPKAGGSYNVTLAVRDPSGNTATRSEPLHVRAALLEDSDLPATVTTVSWLALAGAGASAYGLTDRGRSFLTKFLFLPLYVKVKGEKVLDNEKRGMIRGYIMVHPGDCYTEIGRNLGITNGELAYHLGVLEREKIVRSVTRGTKRLYYPADMAIPEDGGGMHEIQRRLLESVEEVPGLSMKDLASFLGVTSQLALYHVRKLSEQRLVRTERHGVRLRVYATSAEERARHQERLERRGGA